MAQTTFSGPVVSQNGFADNSFTTAERDAIVNPQPGLLIYNTDSNTYEVYNGTSFQPAFGGGPAPGGFPYTFTYTAQSTCSDRLYTIAPSGNAIQYIDPGMNQVLTVPMTTPWDVSTLDVMATTFSPPIAMYMGGQTPGQGFAWNGDGTAFVVGGDNAGASGGTVLWRFGVSSPYDPTTLNSASSGANVNTIRGLVFGQNGYKLYGMYNGIIYQYDFSIPYDINTLVSTNSFDTYSNFSLNNYPQQLSLNGDGTVGVLFTFDGNFGLPQIVQFQLNVAWDITSINTSTYVKTNLTDGQIFNINFGSCVLKPDASKLIVSGFDSSFMQQAYEYSVS